MSNPNDKKESLKDLLKPYLKGIPFIVCGEDDLEGLEFIEDYRDCKIFRNSRGDVVTREAERYIVHHDFAHTTWSDKLKSVKDAIDKSRDFSGGRF